MLFNKKEPSEKSKKKLDVKQIFKNKKSLRIFIIACVAVVIIGGFLTWYFMSHRTSGKAEAVTAQVTRGSISNVIEGTGTVEAISQYEITSLAKGDVISDYFEEGDYVTKDQLLYEIDSASMDKSISKQKSNVEKAQMSYSEKLEAIADLNVTTDVKGVITNLYVSKGDNVSNGTKIADVIDKSTLVLNVPFGEEDAKNMWVGQSAEVTLANSLTTLYGRVTNVGSGTYINSYGVEVTDVEIEADNPGSVTEGESATAMVGRYACYDSASVEYANSKTILAKTSGEVQTIVKKKGDSVKKGDTIVKLTSTSADKSKREAQISLNDANLSLEELYDDLEDYKIKSPIDGKVIQKNIKAGEKLDSNSSSTMAIIADLSSLTFDISIDELDISKISVGQAVSIQADALPGQNFVGKVSNISIVGEAYQGVTSYPVTVTIDNTEESNLIPGMNVEAQIIIDSVEDVLRVPVSAVRMGNLVIVKDDGTFADPLQTDMTAIRENTGKNPVKAESNQAEKSPNKSENKFDMKEMQEKANERLRSMIDSLDVPEGYTVVRVQPGLNDGSFVEIKEIEGSLKEGDTILLPDVTGSATAENAQRQGMPGGMGGGMPGGMGGMPGGMGGGMPGGGMNRQGGGNRQQMR